jgi:TonB family protein
MDVPKGPPELMAVPDAPRSTETAPGPSLRAMSEASAEAVVTKRGPQHAPGNSALERLAEMLARGTGAMAVQRSGYWDAYFTLFRKALLKAWVGEQAQPRFGDRATTRVRLVLDADGLLRDFDIVTGSGNQTLDQELVQALHQTTQFPPPPDHVLHGKLELVTEWELTVHPGLAAAAGTPTFGPFGPAIIFDVVTVVNPKVDLTPLEFNVALASYWTR